MTKQVIDITTKSQNFVVHYSDGTTEDISVGDISKKVHIEVILWKVLNEVGKLTNAAPKKKAGRPAKAE